MPPGAFQNFTKFYQFCGGYLSSLGAPKRVLQHLIQVEKSFEASKNLIRSQRQRIEELEVKLETSRKNCKHLKKVTDEILTSNCISIVI